VQQGNGLPDRIRRAGLAGCLLLLGSVSGWSQESSPGAPSPQSDSTVAAIHELQQQVTELRSAVAAMRSETEQFRAENAELRRALQASGSQLSNAALKPPPAGSYDPVSAPAAETSVHTQERAVDPPAVKAESLEERVASLEESSQLLNSKIGDQYQSKVESGSKYRVRLSGMVLLNLFNNHGAVDNQDFPSFSNGPDSGTGNFGATMRQSEIGLEVFGPTLAGAKTSGNLQADFSGGFPSTWNGVNSGIFRLRIASMRMDWASTSVVAGQDNSFFSPLSPTSFASLAVPALNYAGNLWAWTPQVRVEHRFDISGDQDISVQGGILDNLTGEFPAQQFFRSPSAGESSRQPAYAIRTAWTHSLHGQPLRFGAAGYYSRQEWSFNHYVDGWAGMADWEIPLVARLSLTGEFYRGRAIGGIGGGISQSVVYNGDPTKPATSVHGLDTIGGWSQLKFKATNMIEVNAAVGLDNPTTSEIRAAAASQPYLGALLVRNSAGFVNVVFRPRSSLLFSAEYRHLQTLQLYDISNGAQQFNLMMGILF
jgi:hypothetical protein